MRGEVSRIPGRLSEIFREAAESNRATNEVADEVARRIVENARLNKELQDPTATRRIA